VIVCIEQLEDRWLLSAIGLVKDISPGGDFTPAEVVDAGGGVVAMAADGQHVLAQTVRAATNTTLAASAQTIRFGDAVTLTAIVSASSGVPAGTCRFVDDDGAVLGAAAVGPNGRAVLTTAAVGGGNRTIVAIYEGDGAFAGSEGPVELAVTPAPTVVAVVAASARSTVGAAATFTITVRPPAHNGVAPSGWVTLYDGKRKLRNGQLVNGQAELVTHDLTGGRHVISGKYWGSPDYAGSVSAPVRLDVARCATTTTFEASASSMPVGQSVSFLARVRTPEQWIGAPTGWVLFMEGAALLGYTRLINRTASFTASSLGGGPHSITAVYNGDKSCLGGTSAAASVTMTPATVVDLMALYTPQARVAMGDREAVREAIAHAVGDTNKAMMNSQIPVSVRLVYEGQIAYRESRRLERDLARLATPNDGYIDEVDALRDRYGADLVALFEVEGDWGGMAYSLERLGARSNDELGFSVVLIDQAGAPTYTLAHELGHNFGATHDVENSDEPGVFAYSYGYRFTADGIEHHDIMAYDPGQTIAYFSNPDVEYRGVPTGLAGVADVARTISRTAPEVASYRWQTVRGTVPTSVDVAASAGASVWGKAVTFRAAVGTGDQGMPTGRVIFRDGQTVLGSRLLKNGIAKWNARSLGVGRHSIRAEYVGDDNFAGSRSQAVIRTVYVSSKAARETAMA